MNFTRLVIFSVLMLAIMFAIGCSKIMKPATYSGQCGPIIFEYADIDTSYGNVVAIRQGGNEIRVSNIPCLYKKD